MFKDLWTDRVKQLQSTEAVLQFKANISTGLKLNCRNVFLFWKASTKRSKLDRAEEDVERVGEEDYKKAPIGADPYKFVLFAPGQELRLDAFDG